MELSGENIVAIFEELLDCTCCPRNCHAKRNTEKLGFCQCGMEFGVAAICTHQGEEPVITGSNGICNVFFTHCNMQCIFCQNYQISRNRLNNPEHRLELVVILDRIERTLDQGPKCVGFVSPSHHIPQMKAIIRALESRGRKPIYIMNTNSYDKWETLQSLQNIVDVYLPDFKYIDKKLAERYSSTPDYPEVAMRALKEMFRQKGSYIRLDDNGDIESGLIIRHLILPG